MSYGMPVSGSVPISPAISLPEALQASALPTDVLQIGETGLSQLPTPLVDQGAPELTQQHQSEATLESMFGMVKFLVNAFIRMMDRLVKLNPLSSASQAATAEQTSPLATSPSVTTETGSEQSSFFDSALGYIDKASQVWDRGSEVAGKIWNGLGSAVNKGAEAVSKGASWIGGLFGY